MSANTDFKNLVPHIDEDKPKVTVYVNDKKVEVPECFSVLDACRFAGSFVPTVCYHAALGPLGNCGVCTVDIENTGDSCLSCSTKVQDGMKIRTDSIGVRAKQTNALRRLQAKRQEKVDRKAVKIEGLSEFESMLTWGEDAGVNRTNAITIDNSKCIGCSRCSVACAKQQDIGVLEITADGVQTPGRLSLSQTSCISCGQCSSLCPADAITETSHIERVEAAKLDGKVLIAQVAPAVRVALCEEFGMTFDQFNEKKMVAALRAIGFKHVFDAQWSADLTIMEEGTELVQRLMANWANEEKTAEKPALPMATSCCPAWVNYVEKCRPDLIPHLSTAKSPMMMLGALIRHYFIPTVLKDDNKNFYSVAVMPCTAKKDEIRRNNDIDASLTTRELAKLIRMHHIDPSKIPESDFDHPMGESTGAGAIFGASGGVMEAALRTAYEVISGKPLDDINIMGVRTHGGVKRMEIPIYVKDLGVEKTIRVAVCGGIKAAKKMITDDNFKNEVDFFEVMACPFGCVSGGGQPKSLDPNIADVRTKRTYGIDTKKEIRVSHKNESIDRIYREFLVEPCGPKSHELLHTHYHDRTHEIVKLEEEENDTLAEAVGDGPSITIVYATQTGKSKAVATRVANDIKERGGHVAGIIPTDKAKVETVSGAQHVIFITSTFGNGELPDMAENFYEELTKLADNQFASDSAPQFAVFGLGSTAFPMFCESAIWFDREFARIGLNRFYELGKGDEKHAEGVEGTLGPWLENVYELLELTESGIPEIPIPKLNVTTTPSCAPATAPTGYRWARVVTNETITPPGIDRITRFIELDIEGTGLEYSTGDHVAILPRALDEDVEAFAATTGIDLDCCVQVSPNFAAGAGAGDIPEGLDRPLCVREVFSQYLDISGRVVKPFLKQLIPFAEDKDERMRLMHLVSKEGAEEFRSQFVDEGLTFCETLALFPSCRPSLAHLMVMIPANKPRLYSIASGSNMHPNTIQLVIGKVDWITPGGRQRAGLTTAWIDEQGRYPDRYNPRLAVNCRPSPLRPPQHLEQPAIMLCMGTGLAPFRGWLQHREQQMKENPGVKPGPTHLFFGCRRPDEDFICENELKHWEDIGLLTLHTAFSRVDPNNRVYITHRLADAGNVVREVLQTNAKLYTGEVSVPEEESAKETLEKALGQVGYCGQAGSVVDSLHQSLINGLATEFGTDIAEKAIQIEEDHARRVVFEAW